MGDLSSQICVYTCLAFVLNGIGVMHDGGNLEDVAELLVENKLGC